MNRHMNYFYPYTVSDSHENQLTRAFLALVRLVPAIRQLFFEFLRQEQVRMSHCRCPLPPYYKFVETEVDTQCAQLPQTDWDKLIAVLMTTEKVESQPVEPRNGRAVYDGIIHSPPFVITIENKPKYAGGQNQLNPYIPEDVGEDKVIDPVGIHLVWDELLSSILELLNTPIIGYTEKRLVSDFFDLVQREFPKVTPFTDYSICGRKYQPLYRRSRALLQEVANDRVFDSGSPYIALTSDCVARLYLGGAQDGQDANHIAARLYPGDTKKQAEQLFQRASAESLSSLSNKGWTILPNFHLSYMSTHVCYPEVRADVLRYFEYWSNDPSRFRQLKKDEADMRMNEWVNDEIIERDWLSDMLSQFTETNRESLNVCPGFELVYSWPIGEAEKLDRDGKFIEDFRKKVEEAVAAWGDDFEGMINSDL